MDIRAHNREAWDRQVEQGNPWTVPVSSKAIAAARAGEWAIVLTPTRPVPGDWFPRLAGASVLCLASGGGQLAAGFVITGFYEVRYADDAGDLLGRYLATFMATRALKPG